MAHVVKALALVVKIAPAWVRTLSVAAMKMDVGMTPCSEGASMIQIMMSVEDQLMIAELRLYKKKKKKKKKDRLLIGVLALLPKHRVRGDTKNLENSGPILFYLVLSHWYQV